MIALSALNEEGEVITNLFGYALTKLFHEHLDSRASRGELSSMTLVPLSIVEGIPLAEQVAGVPEIHEMLLRYHQLLEHFAREHLKNSQGMHPRCCNFWRNTQKENWMAVIAYFLGFTRLIWHLRRDESTGDRSARLLPPLVQSYRLLSTLDLEEYTRSTHLGCWRDDVNWCYVSSLTKRSPGGGPQPPRGLIEEFPPPGLELDDVYRLFALEPRDRDASLISELWTTALFTQRNYPSPSLAAVQDARIKFLSFEPSGRDADAKVAYGALWLRAWSDLDPALQRNTEMQWLMAMTDLLHGLVGGSIEGWDREGQWEYRVSTPSHPLDSASPPSQVFLAVLVPLERVLQFICIAYTSKLRDEAIQLGLHIQCETMIRKHRSDVTQVATVRAQIAQARRQYGRLNTKQSLQNKASSQAVGPHDEPTLSTTASPVRDGTATNDESVISPPNSEETGKLAPSASPETQRPPFRSSDDTSPEQHAVAFDLRPGNAASESADKVSPLAGASNTGGSVVPESAADVAERTTEGHQAS